MALPIVQAQVVEMQPVQQPMCVTAAATVPVVSAAPVQMAPASTPMMVRVPDGVGPGQPFQVMGPGGQSVMVSCPPDGYAGKEMQVMVPAATPAMTGYPSAPLAPQVAPTAHPAARNMNGSYPPLETLSLPQPVRTAGDSGKVRTPDLLTGHFHTGSPMITHGFVAPNNGGLMLESDFDASTICAGVATSADPFGGVLSGSPEMLLDVDADGRVTELTKVLEENCCAYLCCMAACPLIGCCIIGCRAIGQGAPLLGTARTEELTGGVRAAAAAHKISLASDCIIVERTSYTGDLMRNYVAFDQYGHRYPACAMTKSNVPPMRLSIPLARAEVGMVPKSELVSAHPYADEMASSCGCVQQSVKGDVVYVKAGEGVKVVVACVETGAASNAAAFVAKCQAATSNPPAISADLNCMFSNWMVGRMAASGQMTGTSNAPSSQKMRRAEPFVKCVGPLPEDLQISKNRLALNRLNGISCDLKKDGRIFTPHHSSFVDQLNAGDRVHSINGVFLQGQADHAWLDQVAEAGRKLPRGAPRYMEVVSTMPYFQPSHLVSVSVPSVSQLPFDRSGKSPPTIRDGMAYGVGPGDVIVQAIVNGMTIPTMSMRPDEFEAACAPAGGTPVTLTVLKATTVAELKHTHTWPIGMPRQTA